MSEHDNIVRFPDGDPTAFQSDAVRRLSKVLRDNGVIFDEFRLDVGAKRGFWTSFMLRGEEHLLTVYSDELNIITRSSLYENYLRHEFASDHTQIGSFSRRLAGLLRDALWELPDEKRQSLIARILARVFRKRA
jgi:hypothetical protein